MKDYNTFAFDEEEQEQNKTRNFLFAIVLMVIGGITLGVGIGSGYALINSRLPQEVAITNPTTAEQDIVTVRVNSLAIPINPHEPSISDIVPLVKDSVVSINVMTQPNRPFGIGSPGSGSGFIFYQSDDYIYIATNNHVIENAYSITISLDDREHASANVVGAHPESDLAVIAVSKQEMAEKGVPFIVATLGDSSAMRMGDTVLAVGNAMGAGQTVTRGIVSALDLNISVNDPNRPGSLHLNVMQTDAAVNRGNSGGPLVNHYGEVIGIVTAKHIGNDVEGMGYALPINAALEILERLKSEGLVRPPFIGIGYDAISDFMSRLFNLPYAGFLIRNVVPGGPADIAGIMVEDMLLYLNDVRLYSFEVFVEELNRHRPGDKVFFTLYRDGEYIEVDLILGVSPR